MVRLVNQQSSLGRGLPLLSGAIVATGVSVLLWSVLIAGFGILR